MASVQNIKKDMFLVSGRSYQQSSDELLLPGTQEICKWAHRTTQLLGTQEISKWAHRITHYNTIHNLEVTFCNSLMHTKNVKSSTPIPTGYSITTRVQASFNGVWKAMENTNLKWRATWDQTGDWGADDERSYYDDNASYLFGILIDFDKDSTGLIESNNMENPKRQTSVVLRHLCNLWENKSQADVTFKCGSEKILAHTLITSSGSPVLNAMFQNNFKEKKERVVEITDIKFDVMEQLVRYIYTGKADFEKVDAGQLLAAADKYDVHSLKEDCGRYLSTTITLENAVLNLVASHLYNVQELLEIATDFLSKNAEAISVRQDWADMLKKYPDLGFMAVQRMVVKSGKML